MQKTAEEWPSLSRMKSCNNRDKNKVSCETLSMVDWYSRRPYEAQHYYYSDGDESDNWKAEPATEAETAEEEEEEEEKGRPEGELENPSYHDGHGFSAQGHHFSACFPVKMVYGKPVVAMASPNRESRKTEKPLRTYPSPIPHSGPIKLHVNMHVSSHSAPLINSKVPATIKTSSIIPPNVARKTKNPGFNTADEPSSPEVTCLGRVRIKQRYCKEIGKLAAVAGVADSDKKQHPTGCHEWKMKLRRKKKKKAGAAEAESASSERGKMALGKAVEVEDTAERGKRNAEKGGKPARKGKWSSAEAMVELTERAKQRWRSKGEATVASEAASGSAAKGMKERWKSREGTADEEKAKFRQGRREWRSRKASEAGVSSPQSDFTIDLSRFSSSGSQRGQGAILAKSLASLMGDGSRRFELEDDTEFVPQVPPRNSLLLMRNSKNRENSASSSSRPHVMNPTMDASVSLSSSREESPKQISSSLEMRMEKQASKACMAGKHQQISSLLDLKMERQCSAAYTEENPQPSTVLLQLKKKAMAHRQASLPKPPPEASLWQRRSIAKPSALDIRNPIKLQIKQPTTR